MTLKILHTLPLPPQDKTGWPWTIESYSQPNSELLYPRITVITPSYNQGKFLEQTIRSVLLQNYPNLEYIIIDGGSNDNSVEIIRKYEKHLTYWTSEPDKGQSHAINKGCLRATGSIMTWLNSDDYYAPDVLHLVSRQLSDNAGNYALVGHCQIVFPESDRSKLAVGHFENITRLAQFWKGYTMPQSSIFWRKEVFEKVGFLNEDYHYTMDFDYWLRIAVHFNFKNIDQILSFATSHGDAKTGDNFESYYRELRKNAKNYWNTLPGLDYGALETSLAHYDEHMAVVSHSLEQVIKFVPDGKSFILVDEDQWETNDLVKGRRRFYFLERDGIYNGCPADDEVALQELKQMQQLGATYLVFASSCFWFLKHYPKFEEHLHTYSTCLFRGSDVIIYELSKN